MSIRTSVKQMLVRQQDKKYEAELAKRRQRSSMEMKICCQRTESV